MQSFFNSFKDIVSSGIHLMKDFLNVCIKKIKYLFKQISYDVNEGKLFSEIFSNNLETLFLIINTISIITIIILLAPFIIIKIIYVYLEILVLMFSIYMIYISIKITKHNKKKEK